MKKKKALTSLIIIILVECIMVAVVTVLFDPFYQYHKPLPGLQAVLNDRDNQMIGTIRNFSYDSVILGSSVCENFDSEVLDEQYDANFIKIIRASGSTADLLYYLSAAHEKQDIRYIYWNIDLAALEASTEVTLYSADTPRYLHTESVLDDFTYLINKDILFEKIPLMLAYSFANKNTGGHAYDWSEEKDFSAVGAMRAYERPKEPLPEQSFEADMDTISTNIDMILNEIHNHPDIRYTLFFPPYSMMWWDKQYMEGTVEEQFYVLKQIMPKLLECDNVRLFYFQSDRDIICDLDNYMDVVHYTPAINQYMLESMEKGDYEVTKNNMDSVIDGMRSTLDYIVKEGIYKYYDK